MGSALEVDIFFSDSYFNEGRNEREELPVASATFSVLYFVCKALDADLCLSVIPLT